MSIRALSLCLFVPLLAACAANQSAPGSLGAPLLAPLLSTGHTTTAGSHQLFPEGAFEQVDLVALLDPERRRQTHVAGGNSPADAATASLAQEGSPNDLERAFRAFYTYGPQLEERRSRLQDRIVAASDQRCNTYKNYLRRVQTTQASWLGSLTTILGGAGAIATHEATVRAFSGLAGITSGVNAELRQSYFSNLATQVIVPGIDLARADIRREMLTRRSSSMGVYTVEAAIAEAARYHGACSMNAGLERSGKAVNEVTNPGLRSVNATLGQLNLAQKLAKRLSDESVDISERDIRLADGVTLAANAAQVQASSWSTQDSGGPYLDRFVSSLRQSADSLLVLRALLDAKVDACKQGKLQAASAACQATDAYVDLTSDASKTTSALPRLATLAMTKVTSQRSAALGAVDVSLKQQELRLLDQFGGSDELSARHSIRKSRLAAEVSYETDLQLFERIANHIRTARLAAAQDRLDVLKKALADVEQELGKIT